MPPVGFEPTISAGERQHIHALDRVATGIGKNKEYERKIRKRRTDPKRCAEETHNGHKKGFVFISL